MAPLNSAEVMRCAIYIRVSTAMQRMEGWSLDAQRASLEEFAKSRGYKVVGVYADEGKSARKRLKDRKEIKRLIDDVEAGLIDVIVFKELDRWFRNISDFYKVQDVLDRQSVTWVSQMQPGLEMKTKEGRLQVNVLLSVGQNETDATSDRIVFTNKYLRQQKRWTSGARTLPRCYTLDDDQHVIIDEEEAPFLMSIKDKFMQTANFRRALIESMEEHGKRMLYNNAMDLFKNEMLYGKYFDVEDFVEKPFMTKEEWETMQRLFPKNAPHRIKRFYIFTSMIECPDCHRGFVGNATMKDGKDYLYYRCPRANVEIDCHNTLSLNESKLEKQLIPFVRQAIADRIVEVKSVKDARKNKPKRKSNRAKLEKEVERARKLYIIDDISLEEFQKRKAEIMSRLIEDEPEEVLPEIVDLEKIQAIFDTGIEAIYEGFTREERREFWLGILTKIYIKDAKVVDVDFIE